MTEALREWKISSGDIQGCVYARREFAVHLRAVSREDADIEGSEVIFGELVANALEHGKGCVTVSLSCTDLDLVLSVHDEGEGFTWCEPGRPEVDDARGRGLYFVALLAKRVGTRDDSKRSIDVVLPAQIREVRSAV